MDRTGGRASTTRGALLIALVVMIGAVIVLLATREETPYVAFAQPAALVDTVTGAPDTEAPVSLSTTTTSSTTTTTTTATTTLAPVQTLQLGLVPSDATATIETYDGERLAVESGYTGEFRGPVTVTVEAPGYQAHTEVLDLTAATVRQIWLDRPGQLLHKVAEWTTAGAPKQVAFTPDNAEVWVTLLNGTGFQVFDPRTGELIKDVELPEAGSVEVIFNDDGSKGYVSQMETASVYEIDVTTKTVLRTLDTEGIWTKVMALSPDEKTLWASNWVSNNVSEFDLVSGEVTRKLNTVLTPRGLYVTPDGESLYVAGFEDGEIEVFDLATGDSETIYRSGGSMRHLAGDPATGLLYASDMARAHVLVVDTATNEVAELAKVDKVPNTIDLGPDGRVLYVSNRGRNNPETYYKPGPEWGTVVLIDTTTGEYLDAIIGGNQTTGLDVSSDGSMLAFSDFLDNRVTVYAIPPYEELVAGGGGRWEAHLAEITK
jgi:DNA-binding beta-propeller fold protein YncE